VFLLLAGCGSSGADEAEPLDAVRAEAVLPGAEVAPGWKAAVEPVAYAQKKARELGVARCYEGPTECAKTRVTGVSALYGAGRPRIDLVLMAYENSAVAQSAYGAVWKAWRGQSIEPRELDLGDIGDESDAVSALGASGEEGARTMLSQVRVGSVIMVTVGEASAGVEMQSSLSKFATVFAERAEQAQRGETPSVTLDDVA
jgi:hypothetical protein